MQFRWRLSLATLTAGSLLLCGASSAAAVASAVAQRAAESVVTVLSSSEQGTAFAYGNPDRLLTNAHVVGAAGTVEVVTASGRRVLGRVVAVDTEVDLALIEAPVQLVPLAPRRSPVQVGEQVIAIGSPLGLAGSVSSGVISAVRRGRSHDAAIQTDVALNPGDSGGPLLDSRGHVLGVNQSHVARAAGISFAIPISDAAKLRRRIIRGAASGTSVALIVGGGAVLSLVCFSLAGGLYLRRRGRVQVKLRPAAARVRYQPEPRVRLKSGDH